MTFHVGETVVCVDDTPTKPGLRWFAGSEIRKGRRYTIRDVGKCVDMDDGVRLHECKLNFMLLRRLYEDQCYMASRFRPINEDTDISQLTAMLGPKEKVRA